MQLNLLPSADRQVKHYLGNSLRKTYRMETTCSCLFFTYVAHMLLTCRNQCEFQVTPRILTSLLSHTVTFLLSVSFSLLSLFLFSHTSKNSTHAYILSHVCVKPSFAVWILFVLSRVAAVRGVKSGSFSLQPGPTMVYLSIPPPSWPSSAGLKHAILQMPAPSWSTAGIPTT